MPSHSPSTPETDRHAPGEPSGRPAGLTAITGRLEALCDAQPFRTGLAVTDLRTGERVRSDAGRVFPAASTRKIAILMATLRTVSRGDLALDEPVTIDERYRDRVFTGLLQDLSPGLTMTLRDALTLMIEVSDNLSTGHVVERIGLDEVNRFCADAGMTRTVHRHALIPKLDRDHPVDATNATTPDDQVRLLLAVLDGARTPAAAGRLGVTPELCRLALDILAGQKFADAVPALLPDAATVAHKTGAGWHDVSDVGIVLRAGEPLFAIAAFTARLPTLLPDGTPGRYAARRHIARLARLCWDACSAEAAPVPSIDGEVSG